MLIEPISPEILQKAADIKLVILDVDGVLTNGQLFFLETEYKAFNAKDGLGIALIMELGIDVAIISGNQSKSVEKRLKKFNIKHIYQGSTDKIVQYKLIINDLGLTANEVAYMGDDLIDLPVMHQVGLATAVFDADPFVKKNADWISAYKGGSGAVRELCELILFAKGKLDSIRNRYLGK